MWESNFNIVNIMLESEKFAVVVLNKMLSKRSPVSKTVNMSQYVYCYLTGSQKKVEQKI